MQGGNVQSGCLTTFQADNKVNLLASQNTDSQTSTQNFSSGSVVVYMNTVFGFEANSNVYTTQSSHTETSGCAGVWQAQAGDYTAASTTTLGGMTLGTTSATGAVSYSAFGSAINAGFSSLASQASVALANNGGDIGATLKQLGSGANVKSLVSSMATASASRQY